ncbi:MAG TPA: 16S rRNA (guanine(966)-N(2))-methyltransferase RsmD [Rhodospirillales bacterium]|nr:16S rRNA (guanine(966)-N(2))-methyltransferase RsmD [Rhodospirillales bacterium]
MKGLRIIAGSLKGRRLAVPRGLLVRPTADRAREALFSILEHGEPALRGSRFLDLFAGSGAVGIEAFSRGAREVLLVEREPAALVALRANLDRIPHRDAIRVMATDATRLGRAPHTFDIAFLDPPYRSGLAGQALEALAAGSWLAPGARVVVELAAREDLATAADYAREDERRYGSCRFLFLRYRGSKPPATS